MSIRLDLANFGVQMRLALTRAFAVSSSLRMSATIATLAGLPAPRSAAYFAFWSGLNRMATREGMYSASRRGFRPPLMNDFPFHWPGSRLCGARPARLPACFLSRVPISGRKVRVSAAAMGPRPGMEHRISRLRCKTSSLAIRRAISASSSAICRSTSARRALIWSSRNGLT